MRYQLPEGTVCISAGGREFTADIDGVITVPDDAGKDVHNTLQSPAMWGLTVLDDIAPAEVATASTPRDAKRHMVALLRALGIAVDGRATFEWLRRRVIDALTAAAAPADPVAAEAVPAVAPAAAAAAAAAPPDEAATLAAAMAAAPAASEDPAPGPDAAQPAA